MTNSKWTNHSWDSWLMLLYLSTRSRGFNMQQSIHFLFIQYILHQHLSYLQNLFVTHFLHSLVCKLCIALFHHIVELGSSRRSSGTATLGHAAADGSNSTEHLKPSSNATVGNDAIKSVIFDGCGRRALASIITIRATSVGLSSREDAGRRAGWNGSNGCRAGAARSRCDNSTLHSCGKDGEEGNSGFHGDNLLSRIRP